MPKIRLNFLPLAQQYFTHKIYIREFTENEYLENYYYYRLPTSNPEVWKKYEISLNSIEGFQEYILNSDLNKELTAKLISLEILEASKEIPSHLEHVERKLDSRTYFSLEKHEKGEKCIWIEPYFLKQEKKWGLLIDFKFVVKPELKNQLDFTLDKEILIASGALDLRGYSNNDYYLYKHTYLAKFRSEILPLLNNTVAQKIDNELLEIDGRSLKQKIYLFNGNQESNSAFMGLLKNSPLNNVQEEVNFRFIYKSLDREIAVSILKGLRGETFTNTFAGLERLFRLPFTNNLITGVSLESFSEPLIEEQISVIINSRKLTIPIIITNSKNTNEDDQLYYWLKYKFTSKGIPCQVITKDLIKDSNALKFSLSNIALQIFSKVGGKPWKVKPATNNCLIIGIGQSYKFSTRNGIKELEKVISYSVLTDSSGLFKDIKVLSENDTEDDSYYAKLISSLTDIINQSGFKKIVIHSSFRLSKEKIIEKVEHAINVNIELSILIINSKTKFFGYDYNNNGLVPYESTFVQLSYSEYLVWFEGLQYNNPKITKRFSNPIYIRLLYTNTSSNFENQSSKEMFLQDCINLSGANWRGFKAKQLPVSIFYCQRISDFIAKFQHYGYGDIEISNLKPWFL